MKNKQSDKNKPKYLCNAQIEQDLKNNYKNMLLNMMKTVITKINGKTDTGTVANR